MKIYNKHSVAIFQNILPQNSFPENPSMAVVCITYSMHKFDPVDVDFLSCVFFGREGEGKRPNLGASLLHKTPKLLMVAAM